MPIVGDVLAERYRLEAVLGVGGMASVFRATDLRLERQVAVKILTATLAADPSFAERFNREASAMAGISHPNVAAVYDVEAGDPTIGREPFFVMELCDGGSLAARLAAEGTLPLAELSPIISAIAGGLAELHARGLIHRDVKPANILFAGDRPELADFGVARDDGRPASEALTLPGSTIGTLAFLAPEILAGEPPSAASDVFALGVTAFLALIGHVPDQDSRAGHVTTGLGAALDAALAGPLDPDPARRPSPVAFAERLAAARSAVGVAPPNPGAIAPGDPNAPTVVETGPPPAVIARPEVPAIATPVAIAESVATEAPSPAPPSPATPRAEPAPRRRAITPQLGVPVAVAIGLLVVAVIAALLLPRLIGDLGVPGGTSGEQPSPTVLPSPSVLPSGAAAILAAVDRVDAAIEAARGGKDGLTGRDANDLAQLAASVRDAVLRGDLAAARASVTTLRDRAKELGKGLDKDRRDALMAAIDELARTLGG